MNTSVSIKNRFVVIGAAVALSVLMAIALLSGCMTQPLNGVTGQDDGLKGRYQDVEMLAGPVVGHGAGGG